MSLTCTMLTVFALAAMMAGAHAQTTDQDHNAHHPDGTGATHTRGAPSNASGNTSMSGQGMGSGVVVQPGTQQPCAQAGMMGNRGDMGQMMPMMRKMMRGQQDSMGMPFEDVAGRIAFLKTELRITDAQKPHWDALPDALRASARTHQSMHDQMTRGGMPFSWPERLAVHQKALSTRLNSPSALEAAATPHYVSLTDEQRKLTGQLLSGPMGML